MAPASLLKLRWKKEMEDLGDGQVETPPRAKRARGSPVPFVAENQLALANDVAIARAYVTEMIANRKARNDILMDDRFLRILMCDKFLKLADDLRDRRVGIDEATSCITELFQATNMVNLSLGFNEFLQKTPQPEGDPLAITLPEEPPLDKLQQAISLPEDDRDKRHQAITLPEENPDKSQLAITLFEEDLHKRQQAITLPEEDLLDTGLQAITMPEEDLHKRQQATTLPEDDRDKRHQAITLPEEDLLDKRQQAVIMPEEDLHERQQATTLPEDDRDKRHQAITLPEEDPDKSQLAITLFEEDLHMRQQATIFNGKLKELGQCKYNAFRMILHMYNNQSVTIKEAHEMAEWPFRDRSDLMQDFKILLPDTSIIPSSSLMLAVEPGQQRPPQPKKARFLIGGKLYCNTMEGERNLVSGESSRHGEPARPADKAREGKERLDIENSKDNMGKKKERKVDNCGFEEHQSQKESQHIAKRRQLLSHDEGKVEGSPEPKRMREHIAKRRQSSSNDGGKDDGFLHLNRMPKGIATMLSDDRDRATGSPQSKRMPSERIANKRHLKSKDGNKDVEFPHLHRMPQDIDNMRQLLSNNVDKVVGSPQFKRTPSERIANKKLLPSNDEGKVAACPHRERVSTRLKRPPETWKDHNIKAKVARSLSLPLVEPIATRAEVEVRHNKCMAWRAQSVEYTWYNWYKDEE